MSSPNGTYTFGPQAEGKALLGLRNGQVIVLAAGMVAALVCLYAGPAGVGAMLTLTIALGTLAVGFLPLHGRTLEQWVPIGIGYALRRLGGELQYRSPATTAGVRVGLDSPGEPDREAALPPDLVDVEMLALPAGAAEIGVLRDRRRDTYTAVLAARVAAFGLLDADEQHRRLTDYGGVLAAIGRDGSPVRRVEWVERTIPSDGDSLAAYLQAERSDSVPISASSVRSYIELIEDAGDVTRDHEVLIALQVDARRGWRAVKRKGGGADGACEVLRSELRSFAANLGRADVVVEGALRPRQYAAAIRHAFDPYGRRSRGRRAKLDPGREGADPALMGPIAAEESWDSYRTDSAVHRTFWVAGWPAVAVAPDFLSPLLMQSDVLRTVAVTMEAIPPGRAIRQAEAETTKEDADVETRASKGRPTPQTIGIPPPTTPSASPHARAVARPRPPIGRRSSPPVTPSCGSPVSSPSRRQTRSSYRSPATTSVMPHNRLDSSSIRCTASRRSASRSRSRCAGACDEPADPRDVNRRGIDGRSAS